MPFFIPAIIIGGTAASLAIQGVSEATRPTVILQRQQTKSVFDFDEKNISLIVIVIMAIIFLFLVVFR